MRKMQRGRREKDRKKELARTCSVRATERARRLHLLPEKKNMEINTSTKRAETSKRRNKKKTKKKTKEAKTRIMQQKRKLDLVSHSPFFSRLRELSQSEQQQNRKWSFVFVSLFFRFILSIRRCLFFCFSAENQENSKICSSQATSQSERPSLVFFCVA